MSASASASATPAAAVPAAPVRLQPIYGMEPREDRIARLAAFGAHMPKELALIAEKYAGRSPFNRMPNRIVGKPQQAIVIRIDQAMQMKLATIRASHNFVAQLAVIPRERGVSIARAIDYHMRCRTLIDSTGNILFTKEFSRTIEVWSGDNFTREIPAVNRRNISFIALINEREVIFVDELNQEIRTCAIDTAHETLIAHYDVDTNHPHFAIPHFSVSQNRFYFFFRPRLCGIPDAHGARVWGLPFNSWSLGDCRQTMSAVDTTLDSFFNDYVEPRYLSSNQNHLVILHQPPARDIGSVISIHEVQVSGEVTTLSAFKIDDYFSECVLSHVGNILWLRPRYDREGAAVPAEGEGEVYDFGPSSSNRATLTLEEEPTTEKAPEAPKVDLAKQVRDAIAGGDFPATGRLLAQLAGLSPEQRNELLKVVLETDKNPLTEEIDYRGSRQSLFNALKGLGAANPPEGERSDIVKIRLNVLEYEWNKQRQ